MGDLQPPQFSAMTTILAIIVNLSGWHMSLPRPSLWLESAHLKFVLLVGAPHTLWEPSRVCAVASLVLSDTWQQLSKKDTLWHSLAHSAFRAKICAPRCAVPCRSGTNMRQVGNWGCDNFFNRKPSHQHLPCVKYRKTLWAHSHIFSSRKEKSFLRKRWEPCL